MAQRQVLRLHKNDNVMIVQDGYDEKQLKIDLENKKNLEVPFDQIIKINSEEKSWGTVLNLEFIEEDKPQKYQFSIVMDWVKYPAKDPMKYMRVDWSSFVKFIEERQIRE